MTKQKNTEALSDQDLDTATGGQQQGRVITDADFNAGLTAAQEQATQKSSGVNAKKVGMTRLFTGG